MYPLEDEAEQVEEEDDGVGAGGRGGDDDEDEEEDEDRQDEYEKDGFIVDEDEEPEEDERDSDEDRHKKRKKKKRESEKNSVLDEDHYELLEDNNITVHRPRAINKSDYKTFRKEGFRHYDILQEIFCGTLATGGLHCASTKQPPTSDEEKIMEDEFLNKGKYVQLESSDEVSHSDCKRRRKDKKVKKSETSEKFAKLDKLSAIWASEASERSMESTLRQQYLQKKIEILTEKEHQNKKEENDAYSIEACMKILNGMEDISDETYAAGLKAFDSANFRKMFVNIPENRRGAILNRYVLL